LSEVAPLPIAEQERAIRAHLQSHQQHEPQRDDIMLLGLRI